MTIVCYIRYAPKLLFFYFFYDLFLNNYYVSSSVFFTFTCRPISSQASTKSSVLLCSASSLSLSESTSSAYKDNQWRTHKFSFGGGKYRCHWWVYDIYGYTIRRSRIWLKDIVTFYPVRTSMKSHFIQCNFGNQRWRQPFKPLGSALVQICKHEMNFTQLSINVRCE